MLSAAVYIYNTLRQAFNVVEATQGTTAAVLQGLLFVTSANSVLFLCVMECVLCGRAILNTTTWTIPTQTSFEFQKHPRSTSAVKQEQQWCNTSEPNAAYTTVYTIPPVVHHTPRVYTAGAIKN